MGPALGKKRRLSRFKRVVAVCLDKDNEQRRRIRWREFAFFYSRQDVPGILKIFLLFILIDLIFLLVATDIRRKNE